MYFSAKNKDHKYNNSKHGGQYKGFYKQKGKGFSKTGSAGKSKKEGQDNTVRLNKYIANAGICSRREADMLISTGVITVNGNVVTELGTKVTPDDVVRYNGEIVKPEKNVYILLNKPKDYITTTSDPMARKTVMHLLKGACKERTYPVGRLDRNTTGLLLLTNDGELAKKLMHPRHRIGKLYHVVLDKNVTKEIMNKIVKGVKLENTTVAADSIAYAGNGQNKKEVGIEIHSGQNRVVRRIFEKFGYKVIKLDRVMFAGLTKKNLPRGKYRFLTRNEINFLKMNTG